MINKLQQDITRAVDTDAQGRSFIGDQGDDGSLAIPVVLVTKVNGKFIYSPHVSKYFFSGSADMTKTFPETMKGFGITNDGTANLTFTIGDEIVAVLPDETFAEYFEPFTDVVIATTGPFRAYGRV